MARNARARRAARPVLRAARAAPALDALLVEGALIAPAQLAAIAAAEAVEQTAADYRLRPGLALRDEIPLAYRVGQTLFAGLTASPQPSTAATAAFTHALMRDVFGFSDSALGSALSGRVPVVVVPPADGLDSASTALTATAGRRTSAAMALQDQLNRDDGALWGVACNGLRLRLMRDNPSLTRPAYIEADLRRIFEADALSDFSALWLLMHASRFGQPGTPPADCALERWRDAGQKVGETARERLREGVEKALALIGDGLLRHPANTALRDRLRGGELPLPEFFNQLLQLAYRMIFLLVAEDRGLLHQPGAPAAARSLYAGGYSLSRLRTRAVQPARDAHDDLWDGLGIVLASLAHGEKRLGLPALDGLFAPGGTPDLDGAALSNRALLDAVRGLAWLDGAGGAPVPVNWRDMETEELGSVYEALLELTPRLVNGGRGFAFAEGAETRGNQRKTTGSYYTPDSLVQALLASALDPVLDRVQAEDRGISVEHSLTKGEAEGPDSYHTKAMFSQMRTEEDSNLGDGLERTVSLPPPADPAAALLSVRVLDPACGSGHFLLAAGRHIAARVARLRAGGTPGAAEYRHALRDVARACLHGVDRNPMAIMLAKVALWIETVEPGLPLGFLDANLRCGDAVLGVFDLNALRLGIPDAAYKALAGDDLFTCRALKERNRAELEGQGSLDAERGGGGLPPVAPLAQAAIAWRTLPEDSPAEIAAKRALFGAAHSTPDSYALHAACDLYVAAFLSPKPSGAEATPRTALVPTTGAVWTRAAGGQVYGPLEGHAVDLARAARAFHWPLEFPDIMAAGGFDAVLGNPPWDVMQLAEEEYFAQRLPEVAELAGAARKRAIAALETSRPEIFISYERDKRILESANEFARASGRFPLTARGKTNTYALFAELFCNVVNDRGRSGVIVPTGIATDAMTAPFFSNLIKTEHFASLFAFENEELIFPAVHHAFKFCVLATKPSDSKELSDFVFFARQTAALNEPERHFSLTREQIAHVNPNTLNAPIFRSRADAALTVAIYQRVPVLIRAGAPAGNPWEVTFRQGLFNMTSDSGLFKTAAQLATLGLARKGPNWVEPPGLRSSQAATHLIDGPSRDSLTLDDGNSRQGCCYVPLYEAKMTNFYDYRAGSYDARGDNRGFRVLPENSIENYQCPDYEPTPYYWVEAHEMKSRLPKAWKNAWLLVWKDVTAGTNERTFIPSIIPVSGVGHTLPIAFIGQGDAKLASCLLACWSSLLVDYITRQKVSGLHLTYGILTQIAVLPPSAYSTAAIAFIVPRVLELTYTSHSLAPFARDLGYAGPPFAWNETRRATLRAELDAWYARAYGLTRDELRYVLDPADTHGPTYPSETFRVLREKELVRHDEYRTRRLVLDAWDRLDDSSR